MRQHKLSCCSAVNGNPILTLNEKQKGIFNKSAKTSQVAEAPTSAHQSPWVEMKVCVVRGTETLITLGL